MDSFHIYIESNGFLFLRWQYFRVCKLKNVLQKFQIMFAD